jgi:hypothetical protein
MRLSFIHISFNSASHWLKPLLALVVSSALVLTSATSFAAAFTPGNIAVYRVGDGAAALVNTGNAVFIDEYTPSGTLVQSIALPTALTGANQPFVASGTATSEGLLTRSQDGNYLLAPGYARAPGGTGSLSGTTGCPY